MVFLLYVLVGTGLILEFGSVVAALPKVARSVTAVFAAAVDAFAFGVIVAWDFSFWTVLLYILAVYRVLNNARVVKGRMHQNFLRRAVLRTGLALATMQALVVLVWAAWSQWHVTGRIVWYALASAQLVAAAVFLAFTLRTLRRTAWPRTEGHYTDKELPTVSVAIPARNETEDLEQCLRALIASDYPKMEILVLDDCSANRRTPEIIRSFAHDGVRFVQGEEPAETWLAKNQAYDKLAHEASGELIIFCGVDVRFAPGSIRQLVTAMLDKRKKMMCILPKRSPEAYARMSLIQAMRYWWELVPPRRVFRRPPVLSSCWIIQAEALKKAGGFAAVSRSIVPEAHFARQSMDGDGYSFMRASNSLGISSVKTVEEQRATAVRMRYPQLHRHPEQVVLLSLAEIALFVLPFVLAVAGFWLPIGGLAQVLAALAGVLVGVTYELVVLSTNVNAWWVGLLAAPFAFLTDIAMLHLSFWRYEFGEVVWRGRNAHFPAMHTIPRLPEF